MSSETWHDNAFSQSVPWYNNSFSRSVPWLENEDSSSSDDELVLLYSLTNRTHWVHPINQRRRRYGEYHHLMQDLELDDERFRTYFRLTRNEFEEVLNLIDSDISKKDTNYREAISSKERLAVCLR